LITHSHWVAQLDHLHSWLLTILIVVWTLAPIVFLCLAWWFLRNQSRIARALEACARRELPPLAPAFTGARAESREVEPQIPLSAFGR
jgi:hypothetical protein